MNCPNCNTHLEENQAICPSCHKVLLLECPNCHTLGESPICENCGYTILVKCSKCKKTELTSKEDCPKCGFSTAVSLGNIECESDEYASIIIEFKALNQIKRSLKSRELYAKFFNKLKNLLYAQIKGVECKFLVYNNIFVINMNKELSLSTSSNKAVRLAIKILNSFVNLNANVIENFSIPLNLTITIVKKTIEELQQIKLYKSNVKPLVLNKNNKSYLKGLQIVLDEYIRDEIAKEYDTDSLYTIEVDGKTVLFYEIVLNKYILPPNSNDDNTVVNAINVDLNK